MKNKWKFIIFLGLSVSFYRCGQEFDNERVVRNGAKFSVEQAQAAYETRGIEELNLKSGSNEDIQIKPDWCNVIVSQNDSSEVIETGLLVQGSFGFADEASSDDWEKTKNPKMITSLSRLVTVRYKKDGRIEQFLMTIMGDKDYHDKGIGKLSDNIYLSRDKQFSGYIFYHDLNGNFVNGWKYVNGKIVRKCSQAQSNIPLMLKTSDCMAVTVTLYNQFCTDWYQNGSYQYTRCENRVSEYEFYYTYCAYEGEGGEGGGFDYIPDEDIPDPDPNQPCPGDPILNPTIASSGASGQRGGMYGCVRQGGSDCSSGIYNKKHGGIDIYAPENSDLYSVCMGTVDFVGYITDLGNCIQITKTDGYTKILYAHLNSASRSVGDRVNTGDKIGFTGKTGNANDPSIIPHVHIQVKRNGYATDPQPYISTKFNSDGSVSSSCIN